MRQKSYHPPHSSRVSILDNQRASPHEVNNLMPLAGAPISQTSQTLQTFPLNSVWYFEPSYGQATLGEPLYMGVYDAAQTSNSAN